MEELVTDILMRMNKTLTNEQMDTLKRVLYMSFNGYKIEKATYELIQYEGNPDEMYIKRFFLAKKMKGLTDRTLKCYKTEIERFLTAINKPIPQITADDLNYFLASYKIQKKVTNITVNNVKRVMTTFFGYLHQQELINKNPASRLENAKVRKVVKEAFTEMEVERMKNACETNRDRAIIEILCSTGCRITELTLIRIDDIKENELVVHGKGEKDRVVYLNAKAVIAIENYLREREDESPFLFPKGTTGGHRGGKNWYMHKENIDVTGRTDGNSIGAMIRKLGKKVGVQHAHPHRFRRTCATFALRNGMPIELVSKMLGHEDISTTQIYLDIDERALKSAHEKYVR